MTDSAQPSAEWYSLHVTVHGAPPSARRGPPCQLAPNDAEPAARNIALTPLELSAEERATPLAVSFEQLAEQLESWPRLFFEPDGSFVWVGQDDEGRRWQLEGYLYDHAGRLQFIELKGQCPRAALDQLFRACGWPAAPLMFQLPRRAVFLAEDDFRRWARQPAP